MRSAYGVPAGGLAWRSSKTGREREKDRRKVDDRGEERRIDLEHARPDHSAAILGIWVFFKGRRDAKTKKKFGIWG